MEFHAAQAYGCERDVVSEDNQKYEDPCNCVWYDKGECRVFHYCWRWKAKCSINMRPYGGLPSKKWAENELEIKGHE